MFKIVENSSIENCEIYNISSKNCEKCYTGYEIQIENEECTPKLWIHLIGTAISFRYVMPTFQIKSIFIDLIEEFWFFSVNSSQEIKAKQLTSLFNALNYESLWPLEIKRNFEKIISDESYNNFLEFMGAKKEVLYKNGKSIKEELFLVDNHNFQFTTSCLTRLCLSSVVLIVLYFTVMVLIKILSFFTTFRLLKGKIVKNTLIITMTSQYYQFVSFYGFHELNSFEGFMNFGERLNIAITVSVVFIFLFLAITLLPLVYSFNSEESLNNKIKSKKTIEKSLKESKKLHKLLAFSYSAEGFFYYLLDGPLKKFIIGSLIGYFEESTFQYIILALLYMIEYYLLITIYKDFEEKPYFIFRKYFVIVTIFYLLFLEENMIHIFSHPSEQFEAVREICLCTLFILGILDTLISMIQFLGKIHKTFEKWKSKSHQTSHSESNSKRVIQIRNHSREPSIAEKLLKRLKETKDSEIIATLPQKKIIYHLSSY